MRCVVEFNDGTTQTYRSFGAAAAAADKGSCTIRPEKGDDKE